MPAKKIRNIIFDLGGVILNINPQLTVNAFRKLGWNDFYDERQKSSNRELFYDLERGNLSPELFRKNVRQRIKNDISDSDIDIAWTAMILDIPAERIRYLEELKKYFRIFLLSNTNEIHKIKFHRIFEKDFGYSFYDLFERIFYSYEIGLRKPNPQIYIQVLNDAGIIAGETLFIDDMDENIQAAQSLGILTLHIQPETLIENLTRYLDDNQ
jgi:glucose-1-phosphatase